MKKTVWAGIVLIAAFYILSMPVLAAGEASVFFLSHSGKTNYFDIEIEPGQSDILGFTLENRSDEAMTNHLLIYDSKTAVNGGNEVMTPYNYTCLDSSSWFEKNCLELTLEPGEKRSMAIPYNVPDDIDNGVYTAILGLYTTSGDTALEEDDVTIRLDRNFSSTLAVVMRSGPGNDAVFSLGDNAEFKVDDATGNSYLMIPIMNEGNSYGFPIIDYTLKDDGSSVIVGTMELDIFYRKTESFAAVPIDAGTIPMGKHSISVNLHEKDGKKHDEAEYMFEIDNGTIKEAIKRSMESDMAQEEDAAWKNDFIVLGKKEIIAGGAGFAGLVCLAVAVIILLKGRGKA